jgi:hypothetical protein
VEDDDPSLRFDEDLTLRREALADASGEVLADWGLAACLRRRRAGALSEPLVRTTAVRVWGSGIYMS